jgi:hypothetical protein
MLRALWEDTVALLLIQSYTVAYSCLPHVNISSLAFGFLARDAWPASAGGCPTLQRYYNRAWSGDIHPIISLSFSSARFDASHQTWQTREYCRYWTRAAGNFVDVTAGYILRVHLVRSSLIGLRDVGDGSPATSKDWSSQIRIIRTMRLLSLTRYGKDQDCIRNSQFGTVWYEQTTYIL